MLEHNFKVRARQHALRLLRPFHKTYALAAEHIPKARLYKFSWMFQAIEIKVMQV